MSGFDEGGEITGSAELEDNGTIGTNLQIPTFFGDPPPSYVDLTLCRPDDRGTLYGHSQIPIV
ncbi:MAG TPA: hypothetical protein VET89_04640 [Stellaceae bacterium]|nr:hypothetical protein [Stellaceae bacterium]